MDIEDLISKIHTRRPIWDKRHKFHTSRSLIEKLWKEIATEMNTDENTLRRKWKYLRDQYSVEIGKGIIPGYEEDGDGLSQSKWPYLHSLHFLRSVVKARSSSTTLQNQSHPKTEIAINEIKVDVNKPVAVKCEPVDSEEDDIPLAEEVKKGNLCNDVSNQTVFTTKKRRLKHLREKEPDEDEMFFKSLLPHVRKIEPCKKMTFRIKIQKLVDEFAYLQDSST